MASSGTDSPVFVFRLNATNQLVRHKKTTKSLPRRDKSAALLGYGRHVFAARLAAEKSDGLARILIRLRRV
jgi:hypothetical protein